MARWDSLGQGDAQFASEPVEWKEVLARSNDFGFLLQDHYADREREPPGECCRTEAAYPVSSKPLLGSLDS